MPLLKKIYTTGLKQDIFTVLDIGSQKIVCLIGKKNDRNAIQIIGIGHNASDGIERGQISDLKKASRTIGQAIQAAEKMADQFQEEVFVNLDGKNDHSKNIIIETELPNHIITQEDLNSIAKEIQIQIPKKDENLIHSQPIHYTLDNTISIADPRGMTGEKLDIEFYTLTTKNAALQNIQHALNQCHINSAGFIKSALSSGLSCLNEDEREIGSVLLDIGAQTTSIALFYKKRPIYTHTIPLGGQDITNDIARGLNTSLFDAERLKILHGHALGHDGGIEFMEVPNIGETDSSNVQTLPKIHLDQIIKARLEEIFELTKNNIVSSGFYHLVKERVIITGGASQLPGLTEFTEKFFLSKARIGYPQPFSGLSNYAGNPSFSCVSGMLSYLMNDVEDYAHPHFSEKISKNPLKKVGKWFKQNF